MIHKGLEKKTEGFENQKKNPNYTQIAASLTGILITENLKKIVVTQSLVKHHSSKLARRIIIVIIIIIIIIIIIVCVRVVPVQLKSFVSGKIIKSREGEIKNTKWEGT